MAHDGPYQLPEEERQMKQREIREIVEVEGGVGVRRIVTSPTAGSDVTCAYVIWPYGGRWPIWPERPATVGPRRGRRRAVVGLGHALLAVDGTDHGLGSGLNKWLLAAAGASPSHWWLRRVEGAAGWQLCGGTAEEFAAEVREMQRCRPSLHPTP